jgi:hypothetical protein
MFTNLRRTKLSPGRESKTLLSAVGYVLPAKMTNMNRILAKTDRKEKKYVKNRRSKTQNR